ncbi:MAG: sugar ABC transporter ATP-binding protein [Bacillota bacterium]
MSETLIRMEGIHKYFPGVHALNNCSFELKKGEVHGLVGENGAGKSTLMKVLTGIYQKDKGTVYYKGETVNFRTPGEARQMGIGMIHQELHLMPHLSVAENIFIGREHMKGILLDNRKTINEARELLESLNIDIDPSTKIQDLTVSKQQMVEIAKALSFKAEVLIMDEPTAALTDNEIEELFKFIRELRAQGVGIIYISHRMEELGKITDRITVMRDGQYIGTVNTADTTIDQIIQMMVGRVIYEQPKTRSMVPEDAPTVLEVKNLSSPLVKNVSFKLKKGEILGIAGLMGSGRTEMARLIFGADPKTGGEIYVNGQKVKINNPYDAVKYGIGYLSEDRKRYGLATDLNVIDNVLLASLRNYIKYGLVDRRKAAEATSRFIKRINIKTPSMEQLLKNLSGGNQQKVVVAKWLLKNCDILIFDEPTRGIDVGSKSEIYKLMNELVHEGKSIIMISSEMPELIRMSDRIAVMREGVLTGTLNIEEATQEKIMRLATLEKSEVMGNG